MYILSINLHFSQIVKNQGFIFPACFVNSQQSLVCNSISKTFPKPSYLSLGNEGGPRPWPCDLGSWSILMKTCTLRLLPCRDHCELRHLCTVPLRTGGSNLSKGPFHSPRRALPHSVANCVFIHWWRLKFLLSVLFWDSLPFLVKQTRFLEGVSLFCFCFCWAQGLNRALSIPAQHFLIGLHPQNSFKGFDLWQDLLCYWG